MATNQRRACQALGLPCRDFPTGTTFALSAANTWLAYSFVAESAKTLSAARAFLSSVANPGSLAVSDLTCELYSAVVATGLPSASLEGPKSITSVPVAGGGWGDWAGFTTTLTAGVLYWLVFKNANASPTVNFPTFRFLNNLPSPGLGTGGRQGWAKLSTTTGAGGFGTLVATTGGYRVAYADGTYDGLPFSQAISSADTVFASREAGVKFTSPANAALNVRGIEFALGTQGGTPTGALQFRLYSGSGAAPTLLGTTNPIPAASVTTGGLYLAYFPAPVTVQPGTVLRATLSDAAADTSGNNYKGTELTIDSDVNSLALMPFQGTLQKTYGSPDNTAFVDTTTGCYAFALLLDSDGESGSSAFPAAADVRRGTADDAGFGTLAVPAASDVRLGTAVDATTGTLVVPGAQAAVVPGTPGDVIDDDTLRAVKALWLAAPASLGLPALVTEPPKWGRLKGPQTLPYAQAACELAARHLTGTGLAWYDDRRVTLKVWALKDDAAAAQAALTGLFNLGTTLTYPSGARFYRFWVDVGPKLYQDETTKDGRDVWVSEVVAVARSVRLL